MMRLRREQKHYSFKTRPNDLKDFRNIEMKYVNFDPTEHKDVTIYD